MNELVDILCGNDLFLKLLQRLLSLLFCVNKCFFTEIIVEREKNCKLHLPTVQLQVILCNRLVCCLLSANPTSNSFLNSKSGYSTGETSYSMLIYEWDYIWLSSVINCYQLTVATCLGEVVIVKSRKRKTEKTLLHVPISVQDRSVDG